MKKKDSTVSILFVIYCVLLVWIILFKTSLSFGELSGLQYRSVNLIPFRESLDLTEIVENILIFVPFGLYLKMLGEDGKKIVLCGFLSSFGLEAAQFILKVGASDITDIITNTGGVLVGVCFYGLLLKAFKNEGKVDKGLTITALISTFLFVALILVLIFANQAPDVMYFLCNVC